MKAGNECQVLGLKITTVPGPPTTCTDLFIFFSITKLSKYSAILASPIINDLLLFYNNKRINLNETYIFKKNTTYIVRLNEKLNLKNQNEWKEYVKSGNKPIDIPANPNKVYINDGWKGFGDWLGTGTIAHKDKKFLSQTVGSITLFTLNIPSRVSNISF